MPRNYSNLRDSYKLYKREEQNPIDVKTYLLIVNGFMKFLIGKLLSKGQINIPERLGTLQIIGKKVKVRMEDGEIKGLAPDWANTKKLWEEDSNARQSKKLVYHFNENTNGVRYRFFWSKGRVLVSNKTLYTLKMTRTNKRALSKLVNKGKEFYIKS